MLAISLIPDAKKRVPKPSFHSPQTQNDPEGGIPSGSLEVLGG
jgi:hypothetical protein